MTFSQIRLKRITLFVLAVAAMLASAPARAAHMELPVVLKQPAPEWPAGADTSADALVPLTIVVGKDGTVQSAEVIQSAGPDLDAAAIAAVKQWTFKPATRDDKPIVAKIRVRVRFVAKEPGPASSRARFRAPGQSRPGARARGRRPRPRNRRSNPQRAPAPKHSPARTPRRSRPAAVPLPSPRTSPSR